MRKLLILLLCFVGVQTKAQFLINPYAFGGISSAGLVLNYDAGNVLSYPGSGSTWTDLSTNTINATLQGTYSYSSTPTGNIVFGSTGTASTANVAAVQINTGTAIVWMRDNSGFAGLRAIFAKENAYSIFINNNQLAFYDWGNSTTRQSSSTLAPNTWYMVAVTWNAIDVGAANNAKLFVNGNSVLTSTMKLTTGGQATTGVWIASNKNTQQLNTGSVSIVYLYNRVLTDAEISQHFAINRSRHGI